MGTVLVVDDSADTLKVMSLFLTRAGHRALPAGSAAEALERLRAERADLAIVDLMMPRETGIHLLRSIRKDPRIRNLPVIVYSAVSEPGHVREALHAGATDYWLKGSIRPSELESHLQAYLPNEGNGWAEPRTAHPMRA
jgi:CheY-like chemotaxis protein